MYRIKFAVHLPHLLCLSRPKYNIIVSCIFLSHIYMLCLLELKIFYNWLHLRADDIIVVLFVTVRR